MRQTIAERIAALTNAREQIARCDALNERARADYLARLPADRSKWTDLDRFVWDGLLDIEKLNKKKRRDVIDAAERELTEIADPLPQDGTAIERALADLALGNFNALSVAAKRAGCTERNLRLSSTYMEAWSRAKAQRLLERHERDGAHVHPPQQDGDDPIGMTNEHCAEAALREVRSRRRVRQRLPTTKKPKSS